MDDEGHGEIGAGRWGEGAFKRGETGGVDGEVREREAVLSVPEMVDDDGDNDASPQLGTLPRRTSSAFLRVDSLARNKSLKSHTQYGSKHFEHWPVWHASFGTLLANFTSPVWIYNLTTYSMFWGNAPAIALWRKDDLEHFLSTDYKSDLSDTTKLRLKEMEDKLFGNGETIFEQWSFYPLNAQGERTAITVDCHCFGIYLPGGEYGFYVEGIPRAASKPLPAASLSSATAANANTSTDLAASTTTTTTTTTTSTTTTSLSAGTSSNLATGSASPATSTISGSKSPSGAIAAGTLMPASEVPSTLSITSTASGSVPSGLPASPQPPTDVLSATGTTAGSSILSASETGSQADTHLSSTELEPQVIQIRESNLRTVESFRHAPYCILLLRPLPPAMELDGVHDPWARTGQDIIIQNPEAMKRFGNVWSFWGSWSDETKRNKAVSQIDSRGSWSDEALVKTKDGSFVWFRIDSRLMNDPVTAGRLLLVYLVDISEQKSLEDQLLKARQEAESGNLAKSEFLAIMSHEIRTPLNSIIGMTTLLMDTEKTMTSEQAKCVGLIRSSGDSLLSILDDILDFTKIESSKFSLHLEPFLLRKMIEDVMDLFRSQCVTRQLRLTHYIAADVPDWVRGDEKRIRQVLWNILGNAVKFSKTGGYVSVDVQRDPTLEGGIKFAVTDTGIGIPANKIGQLFSPFTQADSSVNRRFGGSGLGLALVKRLIGLMNGDITVSSVEGRGSVFRFNMETPECAPEVVSGTMSPGYFALPGSAASIKLITGAQSPETQGQPQLSSSVGSNSSFKLGSKIVGGTVGTPPVTTVGGRLFPFKLGSAATLPRSPLADDSTPGSHHNSPGIDLELTAGKRFLVIHPEETSRKHVEAHCVRELKMVSAGSWADGSDQQAIMDAVNRDRIDLVVLHRSLSSSEADPYIPLVRKADSEKKKKSLTNGDVSAASSQVNEDDKVRDFLKNLLEAVNKRWNCRPAVVMTSWLACAGTKADNSTAAVVNSASAMFVPTVNEFEDLVDANIYIPYRTSGLSEAVLQAMEAAKMDTVRRGSVRSDQTGSEGTDGSPQLEMTTTPPEVAAPKPRRQTKPNSEIDHTLGKRLPMRILAVDDNSVNLLLATRFLEKMGFEGVQCADDGKAAIDMVKDGISKNQPFDLVLMDINMPVVDGLTASREILGHCAGLGIAPPVIIAVTADISEVSQARSLEYGMRGTLTKPIRIQSMQETLMAVGQEVMLTRQQTPTFALKLGDDGDLPAVMKNRLNRNKGMGTTGSEDLNKTI